MFKLTSGFSFLFAKSAPAKRRFPKIFRVSDKNFKYFIFAETTDYKAGFIEIPL